MRVQPETFVSMNSTPMELTSVSTARSFALEGHFPEPVPSHQITSADWFGAFPLEGS